MTGAWDAHDVPRMWQSAQGADTQTAWGQVGHGGSSHDVGRVLRTVASRAMVQKAVGHRSPA